MTATVIKTTGKNYIVRSENREVINCNLKGKFRIAGIKSTNPVVVGDIVEIVQESKRWVITNIRKRKNYIQRKSVNLSKQTHIIAANIDQAFLMITLNSPITTTGFIDRFLVAANSYGINVILLFNKTDLLNAKLKLEQHELQNIYESIGYQCFAISVINDNLSEIKNLMKEKVNMISGHSGVGKSTLINSLQPNLNIKTNKISANHRQGQHTTTYSELHTLDFSASIIDTPGIRGFGLVAIERNKICNFFPEFFALKNDCKFHNCIHENEPNCAVKLALANKEISKIRYNNYLNMLLEDSGNYRKNIY